MELDVFKRLEQEQFALEEKINKLERFMISDDFMNLCDLHKVLLSEQYNYMCSYNNILCVRLRLAGADVGPSDDRKV